jgi:predicted transcriptional regulator
MTTLSITINDELAKALEALAERLGLRKEELVTKLLERQVLPAAGGFITRLSPEDLKELQRQMAGSAERAGYTSEEEILDDIS